MEEYGKYDGLALAGLVRDGEVTPGELLVAALDRAERAQSELNCFSAIFPELAEAQLGGGAASGPFAGVPFATKDLGAGVRGAPLTNGSRAWRGNVCQYDSVLTERFRAAGFTLFAQTTSPEFGLTTSTRGTWGALPADRRVGRAQRLPPASSRSPMPAMAAGRSGYRQRARACLA